MDNLASAVHKVIQASQTGAPPSAYLSTTMDEDDGMSVLDSPLESDDSNNSAVDKSHAVLQTYLDSLPYECESISDMQARLEYIVGRIAICAKSRNWLVLTTWDGALQWFVAISYQSNHYINLAMKAGCY